jgi:hypothetical protein
MPADTGTHAASQKFQLNGVHFGMIYSKFSMYSDRNVMEPVSSRGRARFRRFTAPLMAIVIVLASFAVSPRDPLPQSPAGGDAVGAFMAYGKSLPKPCQKRVVPGVVSLCPLSSFSLAAIPAVAPDHAVPASLRDAPWRMSNSPLPPQCGGLSPYRPPCPIA